MTHDNHSLLVQLAREGKRVVRLKGGDPSCRAGSEEAQAPRLFVSFEVVPGVTAGIAHRRTPEYVTHRTPAQSVTFVTARDPASRNSDELTALAKRVDIVLYMGEDAGGDFPRR